MTQPVDQIDQLLLQAQADNSLLADVQPADIQPADNKMKEKLIQVCC